MKIEKTLNYNFISEDNNFDSYWNNYAFENSSLLWIPHKKYLKNLKINESSLNNTWFESSNYVNDKTSEINWTLNNFEQEITYSIVKTKKIRIYPNKEQIQIFEKWFGASRYVYNFTIDFLKQPNTKANWAKIKKDLLNQLPEWTKEIPFQIKSIAIRDACKTVSKNKIRIKKERKSFYSKHKSKKDTKQSFYVPKTSITEKGIFPRLVGEMKWCELLPDNICDSYLIKENHRYFICIPYHYNNVFIDNQNKDVVAIDPGIRTFLTYFSQNKCGKIGENIYEKINRINDNISKLFKILSKTKTFIKRSNIYRLISKLICKRGDLIKELHFKSALFLVKNFDIILIPKLNTTDIIKKSKLNHSIKEVLISLSHKKFRKILKQKAKEYGKIVLEVNESYTSKTVSWTGEIDNNLKGKKYIKSEKTNMIMDRDLNAARGILLRAMGDTPNN